jgi:hypothetical protein
MRSPTSIGSAVVLGMSDDSLVLLRAAGTWSVDGERAWRDARGVGQCSGMTPDEWLVLFQPRRSNPRGSQAAARPSAPLLVIATRPILRSMPSKIR